jgi:hypothetical protein
MKRLMLILFLGAILPSISIAQWEKSADRYKDAYKAYLDASCPLEADSMKHFVYFARDREQIHDHPLLTIERFCGAQIMYSWVQLEPSKGAYDFSSIREDIAYLSTYGKKLFVQLQDASFNPAFHAVPEYLRTREYDGGEIYQRTEDGDPEGWVAKRWNSKVQERFALLLKALGDEFDGVIEGINLQETAIGVSNEYDPSFTSAVYSSAVKVNMLALKKAFPLSTTMIYANFMSGEWLPWEDKGYLRSVYKYGEEIGVGLGGPDLMLTRIGQLNHALALMHEHEYTVALGIAIQDGNYIGKTGADKDYNEAMDLGNPGKNLVPLLHAFGKDFLKLDYMFWVNQEPYFESLVVPCFSGK